MYHTYRKTPSAGLVSDWDRVVLVTGASAGLGKDFAVSLVKNGFRVAACARRVERVQALIDNELAEVHNASERLLPIQCDVSKEEEIIRMFAEVKAKFGGVDVLINNAGVVRSCGVVKGDTAGWKEMLDVNVLGLCLCTREALQMMKEVGTKNGMIINIGSIAGHMVVSPFFYYSATKFAVTALTEGLRQELLAEGSDVRVAQVSMGYVDTDIGDRMIGPAWRDFLDSTHHLDVRDVTEAVKYVISAPPHVQISNIVIHPIGQPNQ